EILGTESNLSWVGRAKKLRLVGHAVRILPKLGLSEENRMEEIRLDAGSFHHISEMFKAETNSIGMGRVNNMILTGYATGIFPKLRFQRENETGGLMLSSEFITSNEEVFKVENNSVWIGKIQREINDFN
ncbi:MAG: uncharacterized protein A8A55_3563, partial [Amphiamblys sp. WSBS2006]